MASKFCANRSISACVYDSRDARKHTALLKREFLETEAVAVVVVVALVRRGGDGMGVVVRPDDREAGLSLTTNKERGIANGLLLLQHHLTFVKEAHIRTYREGKSEGEGLTL